MSLHCSDIIKGYAIIILNAILYKIIMMIFYHNLLSKTDGPDGNFRFSASARLELTFS